MTYALVALCCIALCSITYRIRGGMLEAWRLPGQISRLTFAAAASFTAWVAGADPILAVMLVPLWFAGTTLPLWDSIDLGSHEGEFWPDFRSLALRGAIGALPPAVALQIAGFDGLALVIAGSLMAPAYWLGSKLPITAPGLGTSVDFIPRGEALAGALYGLGTITALAF